MSIIDELEWAIDMVDLVSRYTKLKKSWANYKALCPFPWHNEKTPSFMVSPTKQIGYCFGCHKWGWPIKFIMDIENCEFTFDTTNATFAQGILAGIRFGKQVNEQSRGCHQVC